MFNNLKIKEKIGDKYYFEEDGKNGGCFTKDMIYRISCKIESSPMMTRKRLVEEYEESERKKQDENFEKYGGIRNSVIAGDFCNNTGESMDGVFLAKGGSNNKFTKLKNLTVLGRFDNNYLGKGIKKILEFKKEHPFLFVLNNIFIIISILILFISNDYYYQLFIRIYALFGIFQVICNLYKFIKA